MDQAFMLILHDPPTRPLTDEQVAQMKMPLQRIEAIIKTLDTDQEGVLQNTGKWTLPICLCSEPAIPPMPEGALQFSGQ